MNNETPRPTPDQLREQYKQWLSNLKVGDTVCVEHHSAFQGSGKLITKIVKITPKRWITVEKYPDRHFKDGQYDSGTNFSSTWYKLIPVTPEIEEEIKLRFACNLIKNMDISLLTPDQIKRIYNIIKESPK